MFIDKRDKALQWFSRGCALCSTVILIVLYLFIAGEGLSIWLDLGLSQILFNRDWQPIGTPASYGILPMIVSTLWSSLGAMLLAAPLGICCGIFLSEYAPAWLSPLLRVVLNILTGIPSVVYGFLGASVIVPWFETVTGAPSGESLFCASLVLSIMVVPYIVTGTYSAFKSISTDYREVSYGLGVYKTLFDRKGISSNRLPRYD